LRRWATASSRSRPRPLGRAAGSAEIAAAIVFLASEDASYLNGAIVAVDGGRIAV
jgi:NAD(P)-dependent dehydrogenase (short-subunit alcohol dehydrogenase family)